MPRLRTTLKTAGSFEHRYDVEKMFRYLIDTGGIEKFKRLYSSARWPMPAAEVCSAFQEIYQVPFALVVGDWERFVMNQE